MSEEHDFAWRYLPGYRKQLYGASRLVWLTRLGVSAWVPILDVTPAELSIMVAFAKAAESKKKRQLDRFIASKKKRR